MAPMVTRKRKSQEADATPRAATPTGSPAPKRMKITHTQKQALMDNLQLEITERARQLRAGYALQCADLRARIERRVNRIPLAVRKMTMGQLMAQHETTKTAPTHPTQPTVSPTKQTAVIGASRERPLPPLPPKSSEKSAPWVRPQTQYSPVRGHKRKSSDVHICSDKENETAGGLAVAKNHKRAKTTAPTRTVSRSTKQNSVLSPRSHNSRTLPRSPVKDYPLGPSSPAKSLIARPISPLKPASPLKTAATAATSAITASVHGMIEHAKRGTAGKLSRTASKETKSTTNLKGVMLPPPRPGPSAPSSPQRAVSQASHHSNSTEVSTASSSTTVVKPRRGGTRAAAQPKEPKTAAPKRGVAKAASAAKTALTRSATTTKKPVAEPPAPTRRVLRKRT